MSNSLHHLIHLTLKKQCSLLMVALFSLITTPVFAQDAAESTATIQASEVENDLVEQPATRQVQDHKSPEQYYTVETHLGFGIHRVMSDHALTYDLIEILATTDSYVMLDEVADDELANHSPLFIITPPTSLASSSAAQDAAGDTQETLTATTYIQISLDDLIDLFQQLEYLKNLNQTYGYTLNQTNHFLHSLFQALHLHVIHHGLTADDELTEDEDLMSDVDSVEGGEDSENEVTTATTDQESPESDGDNFTLTYMLNEPSHPSQVSIDYETGGQLMEILGGLPSFNFITSSLDYHKDPATGALTLMSTWADEFVVLVAYTQLVDAELTDLAGSVTPHGHLAAFYVSIDDWLSEANQANLAALAHANLSEFIAKVNAHVSADQAAKDSTHEAEEAQTAQTDLNMEPALEDNAALKTPEAHQADLPSATANFANPTASATPESLNHEDEVSASSMSSSEAAIPETSATASRAAGASSCLYIANPKHEEFINELPAPESKDDQPVSFKEYRQNQLNQQQRYEHLLAFEPKVMVATQILLQEFPDAKIHITPGSGQYQSYTKVCAL